MKKPEQKLVIKPNHNNKSTNEISNNELILKQNISMYNRIKKTIKKWTNSK